MTLAQLFPGDHTITWSLPEYGTITAKININLQGMATCIEVTNGTCDTSNPPGVIAWGNTVEAYLSKLTATTDFEIWVQSKGGPTGIHQNISAVEEILDAYLGTVNLGFSVTVSNVYIVIDYYLGV